MRLIDADELEELLAGDLEWIKQKYGETSELSRFNLGVVAATRQDLNYVRNAPTVDVVTWKDFRDFLDDNAEDFESINKRLDALEERV